MSQIRIWASHLCRRRDATVIGHRRFRNHHPRKVCLLSCLLFPSVQFRRLLSFCLWRIMIKKLGSNWVLGLIHLADHHMLSIQELMGVIHFSSEHVLQNLNLFWLIYENFRISLLALKTEQMEMSATYKRDRRSRDRLSVGCRFFLSLDVDPE